MRRTWEDVRDSRRALETAEGKGIVADSKEVRLALMQQFHSGVRTLEEVQAELAVIKRGANKNGKLTRDQAYRGGRS